MLGDLLYLCIIYLLLFWERRKLISVLICLVVFSLLSLLIKDFGPQLLPLLKNSPAIFCHSQTGRLQRRKIINGSTLAEDLTSGSSWLQANSFIVSHLVPLNLANGMFFKHIQWSYDFNSLSLCLSGVLMNTCQF